MIYGLLDRMSRPSSEKCHDENYYRIERLLRSNGYPGSLILATINKFKEWLGNNVSSRVRTNNFISYCRFPFVPDLSYRVGRCFLGTNVKLTFYNVRKINSLYTRLKDPISRDLRAGVTYKIPCSCGLCFIGQTKQYLKNRVSQYINCCRNTKILNENKTALAAHYLDSGCNVDFF